MLNLFAMSDREKKSRATFRCVHRHDGFRHPHCYDQENMLFERVGFLDIETSQLNANFGIILTYCILGNDGELHKAKITPDEIRSGVFDLNVCKQLCDDIRKFDRVIGYYSEKFDIPFCRTRCLKHKLDFPIFKEVKHTDAWRITRSRLKLHSNRLGVVCSFFGIEAKTHPLDPDNWLKCLSGNQDSIDFVLTHNIEDVVSLKKLWERIEPYQKLTNASI